MPAIQVVSFGMLGDREWELLEPLLLDLIRTYAGESRNRVFSSMLIVKNNDLS